ncbi:MAG TPA: AI-2E family transporter [Actinomycetota bacterium]|nr:AI-2E family transporter [Actinomycetota bacterium]
MEPDHTSVLSHPFVRRAARWGVVAWALIGVLILVFALFRYVIFPIRIVFPPLVVALIVVYILNPLVSSLERRGIRRIWGSLLVYLVFAGVVGTGLSFLVPAVAEQVNAFIDAAPRLLMRLTESFREVASRFGLDVEGAAAPSQEGIIGFLGGLVSFTQGLVELAIIFVLGPILAFYFLVDLPKIKRNLRALIPARRRPELDAVLERMGAAVGGFFRGQLLVALFVGLASSLALWIVGLPFWAVVGLTTGLFNLIPLIGPFIGGAVAVFIALTSPESGGLLGLQPGWQLAVGSAVGLLIVQQIDNHVLSPNIVGRTVRLHPVTVMLGLLVGGTLLGLWGMLLAIPVIASVKIVFLHYWDTRMTWPPPSAPEGSATDVEEAAEGAPRPEGGRPSAPAPAPAAGGGVAVEHSDERPSAAPSGGGTGWFHAVRGLFGSRRQTAADGPEVHRREPAGERRRGSSA